jgi:hypothetical protein
MKAQHDRYTVRKGQLTLVQKEHTMLARIITLVILCAAITSCGSQNSPVASNATPETPIVNPAIKPVTEVNIANRLDLSDAQRQGLQALQTQYEADLAFIAQTATVGNDESLDLGEEFESSFHALLNAEQQAEYQALKSKSQDIVKKLSNKEI